MMKSILLTSCVACLFALQPAGACTLFAAAGPEAVKDGGVLIAKIRDEKPFKQTYRQVNDGKGYAFEGIFGGANQKFNMGINEKGFVVARSTAGSIPTKQREQIPIFKSPRDKYRGPEFLIRNCATVEEALAQKQVFTGRPINYIMADATTIAVVEVLPDGAHTVRKTQRGTLAHTNHFTHEKALQFNQKIGKSSQIRYERIQALLDQSQRPFTFDDFVRFTEDRNDGPNNSLWREGSSKANIRTLSAMVVELDRNGKAKLYMKYQAEPVKNSEWIVKKKHFEIQ